MPHSLWPCFCALLLITSIVSSRSFDDLDHVTFEGAVRDANGGALRAAQITLKQLNTDQQRSALTKADGSYRLSSLPPGTYELRVEARGFQTVIYQNLNAVAGQTLRRDFQLRPAQ